MKKSLFSSLLLFSIFISLALIQMSNEKKCRHNGIKYSVDDYSEYKESYAKMFRDVANEKFSKCICGQLPKHFNHEIRDRSNTSVVIEPLYINRQDCNGIYAQRIFGGISARYVNGGHPHSIFIIDEKKFFEYSYKDSTVLKESLFSHKYVFTKHYSTIELDSLYQEIKSGTVWSYASILAPFKIKDNDKTIYDAFHE